MARAADSSGLASNLNSRGVRTETEQILRDSWGRGRCGRLVLCAPERL